MSSAPAAGSGSGGDVSPLIISGVPALLAVLGAFVAGRLRRRTTAADTDGSE